MNILMIPSWYHSKDVPTGGSFFKEQAEALVNAGHEVTILYCEVFGFKSLNRYINYDEQYYKLENGVNVYRIKKFSFFKIKSMGLHKALTQGIEELYLDNFKKKNHHIDIIHIQSSMWAGYAGMVLSKKYDIPFVITEHSTAFGSNKIYKCHIRTLKKIFRKASQTICVSEGLKRDLIKQVGEVDIKIVGNVVNTENFNIIGTLKKDTDFKFLTVCYFGSEHGIYKKGIDILFRAFSELLLKKENVTLYVGGGGEKLDDIISYAKKLNIQHKIKFLGQLSREEVNYYMNLCDVFILPSRYETFGVVYIEALACGKPVIATRTGGPDSFIDDSNGILVDIDDQIELENAMYRICQTYEKYNPIEIRNRCISQFSSESIADQLTNIYIDILKTGGENESC